jgi:hypothetical protein
MVSDEEETKPLAFQRPGSLTTSETKIRVPTFRSYVHNNLQVYMVYHPIKPYLQKRRCDIRKFCNTGIVT